MSTVDVQCDRLSYFHPGDPDLRIEHDQADRGADKDEVGFKLRDGSGEEKVRIRASRRDLADLQVELQVVHSADGIRLIDFHGQLVSFAVVGQTCFL